MTGSLRAVFRFDQFALEAGGFHADVDEAPGMFGKLHIVVRHARALLKRREYFKKKQTEATPDLERFYSLVLDRGDAHVWLDHVLGDDEVVNVKVARAPPLHVARGPIARGRASEGATRPQREGGPHGAGVQLSAQHSQTFESFYGHFPGLKVVAPASPADAKGMLKTAIRGRDPVIFLESAALYGMKGEVPDDTDFTVPFGESRIARDGTLKFSRH